MKKNRPILLNKINISGRFILFALYLLTSIITNIIAESPSNPLKYYHQGRIAYERGDYYTALEQYQEAVRLNPNYTNAYKGLAKTFFMLEGYSLGLHHISKARDLDKHSTELMVLEARLKTALGRYQEAETLLTKVLDLEPFNQTARFGLAELEIAKGNVVQALDRYLEHLKRSPENRRALLSVIIIYHDLKNQKEAERFITIALDAHPEDPNIRFLAAKHYLYLNNLNKAEEQAQAALRINPNNKNHYYLLASVFYLQERYEKCIEVLYSFLRNNRREPLFWYLLGESYSKLNKPEYAFNSFANALIYGPQQEIVRIALEQLLLDTYAPDSSERGRYADYHFERASEFDARNYTTQAIDFYRRGLLLYPYHKDGRLEYGKIFRRQEHYSKYLANLNVLIDEGYDDTFILDEIETYENLLFDTVEQNWDVDQFQLERHRYSISLYTIPSPDRLKHIGAHLHLLRLLKHSLLRYENIEISSVNTVSNFSQGFQTARDNEDDLFIFIDFNELERSFAVQGHIYYGRTGTLLHNFSFFRTGNDRVWNALSRSAGHIKELLPLQGSIVNRSFDRALIDLGKIDGISEEDILFIIRKEDVSLDMEKLRLIFNPDNLLGELEIIKSDELISEAIIKKYNFFDLINPGDKVILYSEPKEEIPSLDRTTAATTAELYKSILQIP